MIREPFFAKDPAASGYRCVFGWLTRVANRRIHVLKPRSAYEEATCLRLFDLGVFSHGWNGGGRAGMR